MQSSLLSEITREVHGNDRYIFIHFISTKKFKIESKFAGVTVTVSTELEVPEKLEITFYSIYSGISTKK